MARIHNLSSRLTLNTKSFTTGLARARKSATEFGKRMGRAAKRTAAVGAAASAAAVGGLALLYRQNSAHIDQTAKFARSIGIQTENLMGLRHAGELAGVGQAKLDQSLQQMVRRVGEASSGTGSAVKALDTLGLSANELARLAPDEQFTRIAEQIAGFVLPGPIT